MGDEWNMRRSEDGVFSESNVQSMNRKQGTTERMNRLEETVNRLLAFITSEVKIPQSPTVPPSFPSSAEIRGRSQLSIATRERAREMEIITAPPIPLCTFYCQFSNRKTAAAEKKEGYKLYRALPVSPPPASILPLPSSLPSSLPPLDGQFLFPFPLRRHSRVNSSPSRRQTYQLSPLAERPDTSLAQNKNNSHRRRRKCFQDGRNFLLCIFSALR